jgi:hypothetical protein
VYLTKVIPEMHRHTKFEWSPLDRCYDIPPFYINKKNDLCTDYLDIFLIEIMSTYLGLTLTLTVTDNGCNFPIIYMGVIYLISTKRTICVQIILIFSLYILRFLHHYSIKTKNIVCIYWYLYSKW